MPDYDKKKFIHRILDANINRLKEGLRVLEEIARFVLNSKKLTAEFKKTRHEIDSVIKASSFFWTDLLKERESLKDVGRSLDLGELERDNFRDIFFANMQRVKESLRVLEEFTKLSDKNLPLKFKKIRYRIYELEKKAAKKIPDLCHHR